MQGKGVFEGRPVDFEQRIIGDRDWERQGLDLWNLKVFGTGTTWLIAAGSYGDDELICTSNVFVITKKEDLGGESVWEKSVKDVKLTLEECKPVAENSGSQECGIKIGGDVGLDWNTNLKPKVILLS